MTVMKTKPEKPKLTDADRMALVEAFDGYQFNDLLRKRNIPWTDTLMIRHTPSEPELKRVLPWMAAEHPRLFNAYQSIQSPRAEGRMKKRSHLASFIAVEGGLCLFVGLYRKVGGRDVSFEEFVEHPDMQELVRYGMKLPEPRPALHLFDLEPVADFHPHLSGRLVCSMSEGREFLRRSEMNVFEVVRLHEQSLLTPEMPPWNELVLTWDELKVIPETWKARLREWRGLYYIFDTEIELGYVGSAGGADNILGRWLNYAATGHGGNVKLRGRNPANFRFSILERPSPDMPQDEICALETLWKLRLHTREHGLNDN